MFLFGKLDALCFLKTPVLRFALLPHFRRKCAKKSEVEDKVFMIMGEGILPESEGYFKPHLELCHA